MNIFSENISALIILSNEGVFYLRRELNEYNMWYV